MTVADAVTVNDLEIIGPQGLNHHLAAARFYTYRENLRVKTSEILAEPSPEPVFKDHNVTVYALPLSTEASLKRKRSPSPEGSRKKPTSTDTSDTRPNRTLASLLAAPGFKPSYLTSNLADEWRKLLIQRMFPATGDQLVNSKSQGGKKGKAPQMCESSLSSCLSHSSTDIEQQRTMTLQTTIEGPVVDPHLGSTACSQHQL